MKMLITLIKGIAFIVFLLALSYVNAKADSIYTGAWSKHLSSSEAYEVKTLKPQYCSKFICTTETYVDTTTISKNSNHNLFAYATDDFIVGTYKNSYYDRTTFVGYEIIDKHYGNFNLQLYATAAYGYRNCLGADQYNYDDVGTPTLRNKRVCGNVVSILSYTEFKAKPSLILLNDAIAFSIKWDIN